MCGRSKLSSATHSHFRTGKRGEWRGCTGSKAFFDRLEVRNPVFASSVSGSGGSENEDPMRQSHKGKMFLNNGINEDLARDHLYKII